MEQLKANEQKVNIPREETVSKEDINDINSYNPNESDNNDYHNWNNNDTVNSNDNKHFFDINAEPNTEVNSKENTFKADKETLREEDVKDANMNQKNEGDTRNNNNTSMAFLFEQFNNWNSEQKAFVMNYIESQQPNRTQVKTQSQGEEPKVIVKEIVDINNETVSDNKVPANNNINNTNEQLNDKERETENYKTPEPEEENKDRKTNDNNNNNYQSHDSNENNFNILNSIANNNLNSENYNSDNKPDDNIINFLNTPELDNDQYLYDDQNTFNMMTQNVYIPDIEPPEIELPTQQELESNINELNNLQNPGSMENTDYNQTQFLQHIPSQPINDLNQNFQWTLSQQQQIFPQFQFQFNSYKANLFQSLPSTANSLLLNPFLNVQSHILKKTYSSDQLKSEYHSLKQIQQENPALIQSNIHKFESNILLPLYQNINRSINCKSSIYSEIYNRYRTLINNILNKTNGENSFVQAYGSIWNNFLIDDGDIDICIVPSNCTVEAFANKYLNKIKNEILNKQLGKYIQSHITPRYSLWKTQDNDTGIIIDITFHTMLPIYNTKLIRNYSLYDQRFHIMGLYWKHWAKRNKINGATEKYWSSYALWLMLIHFLQTEVKPTVLPILQKIENTSINYEYSHSDTILNTNVYFEENQEKIENYMNIINNNEPNTESVTELIIKFFEYYSYKYEHHNWISISNSDMKLSSSEYIAFPIEDPFDIEHNPGKSMKFGTPQYEMFMNYMKREINYIWSGEYSKLGVGYNNGNNGNSGNNSSINNTGNNYTGNQTSNNSNDLLW